MYFVQQHSRNLIKAIFSSFRDFVGWGGGGGGVECVLVKLLLIKTLTGYYFVLEGRLSYPLSGDMTILCAG